MITRSKLIAAVLGLAVSAGAIGDASAATIGKIVKIHTVVIKSTTRAVPSLHRRHVGTRVARHVGIVRRAPIGAGRKVVRVVKPLLQKQAFAHRLVVRKTIIR